MSDEIFAYVKELGDRFYIQSPVSLYEPDELEIGALTFAEEIKKLAPKVKELAPNPNILWLNGRYVEADKANANGDQWTAGEIGLKQLTPNFMPITVMHDLRTAVGLVANTQLVLPSESEEVQRARLETMLALWAHRFPHVAEEARINARQGTLMQSMECKSPAYECSVCSAFYQITADRSDRGQWCPHLKGEVDASGTVQKGARILRSVVFTGTGLIFGTRGARGAYSEAHLEVEALAEFHAKAQSDKRPSPKPRRKNVMEIEDRDYQALVAEKATAENEVTTLKARLAEKDGEIEAAEQAKVKAEGERDDEKKRADKAEETARVANLREERLAKLGAGFTTKLAKMETTSKRVQAQAGELSDEDWNTRLAELEETLEVKRDAAATANADEAKIEKLIAEGKTRAEAEAALKPAGESTEDVSTAGLMFSRSDAADAEISAAANGGGEGGAGAKAPSREARRSVLGGLIKPSRPTTTSGAGK